MNIAFHIILNIPSHDIQFVSVLPHNPEQVNDIMKGTKTVSLFATLSIILASLVALVSPIVDVDCGADPSHFVADSREVVNSFAKEDSAAQSNTIYESIAKQLLETCGHDAEVLHMHGAHDHMVVIPTSAAIDFGSSSVIAPPPPNS